MTFSYKRLPARNDYVITLWTTPRDGAGSSTLTDRSALSAHLWDYQVPIYGHIDRQRLQSKVDTDRAGTPSRLVVVTAGGYGYEHPDGATITPITALGP